MSLGRIARTILAALGVTNACRSADTNRRAADSVAGTGPSAHVCPATRPEWWTAADMTLAAGPRCAVVARAAAALEAGARRDGALAGVRLADVMCVTAERMVLRDSAQQVVADTWVVAFYSDRQPDIVATMRADNENHEPHVFIQGRDVLATTRELCAPAT